MVSEHPKVFVSYSHDSLEHAERVLKVAERLRNEGVDAKLDQYVSGTPSEGWPRWMLNQLDWAEFVLVVCTETYYRRFRGHENLGQGRGADWEGNLITLEMYDAKSITTRFVPILFDRQNERFIPEPLRGHTRYLLNSGVPTRKLGPFNTLAGKPIETLEFESLKGQGRPAGKLHGVPDLPPHYIHRQADLDGMKQKLLAGGANVGNTGQSSAVGVQGMGGIGKSVLAAALARDSKVRQTFCDGVYWVTIGQNPNLLELQNQLLRRLTGSREILTTESGSVAAGAAEFPVWFLPATG